MDADIIRMAREAGLFHFYDSEGDVTGITDARLVDEDKHRNDERLVEILGPLIALVRAAEQDRCCRIVFGMAGSDNVAQRTVDAIRSKA